MTDNTTQPGVRVNDSVWQQFRSDVRERKGAVNGYLSNEVENALVEYMNASDGGDTHDRLTSIEGELQEMRTLLENSDQTKKDSGLSTTMENRLADIRQTIADEVDGSPKVHEEVVELAIRRNAGGSDPTIRKYKDLLREDRELFPHPTNDSLYFRDATDFVLATNTMAEAGKVGKDDYLELVEDQYGREWWADQIPAAETDEGDPTYQ